MVDTLETMAVTNRLQITIHTTKLFRGGPKGWIGGCGEEDTGVFLEPGQLRSTRRDSDAERPEPPRAPRSCRSTPPGHARSDSADRRCESVRRRSCRSPESTDPAS